VSPTGAQLGSPGAPTAPNLTLWRLALVTFAPPPRQGNSFGATFEGADVQTLRSQEKDEQLSVLMAAGVKLRYRPKLAGGRFVVVPDDARRAAERALEIVVNTVAVAERCSRAIASPFPWVAFEPTDEDARLWLDAAEGIHELDRIVDFPSITALPLGLDDADVMGGLADRWDGVALLAEAFAHKHPTGRLHELFRVLERAFALSARKLGPVLVNFLHPRYGYTAEEVDGWIKLRDPATHADVRHEFVLEAEVRPALRRMEQAAVDVLVNKTNWRCSDPNRRELWRPTAWTKSKLGEGVTHIRTPGRVESQLLDQFGAYPTYLAGVTTRLPDNWWAPAVTPKSEQRAFRVLPEGQLDE
jgi:hypothetical protein